MPVGCWHSGSLWFSNNDGGSRSVGGKYLYLRETPDSHLEIVWRETFSSAPSSSWDSPMDLRRLISFSLNFMMCLLVLTVWCRVRPQDQYARRHAFWQATMVGNLSTGRNMAEIPRLQAGLESMHPVSAHKKPGGSLFEQHPIC